MDNSIKAMLAVITFVVLAVGGVYISSQWNLQTQGPPAAKPNPLQGFLSISAVSEMDPSLTANAGAASAYTIWHMKSPGVWPLSAKNDIYSPSTLSVSSAVSVGIGTADNQQTGAGYRAFLVLQVYSGTADYAVISAMLDKEPFLVNQQTNLDLGTTGYPAVLFLMDVTGFPLSATAGVATPVPLTAYLVVDDVTLSSNSPSDVEVAGAGAQSGTGIINWQWTFTSDAEKKAFVIGRIYVSMNRTDDYVSAGKLTLTSFDGTQYVYQSPTTESRTTTSYAAYYVPANGVNYRWTYSGLLMDRAPGTNTYVGIAWGYTYSFPAAGTGYATICTLYTTTVAPTGNGGTTADNTDAVIIKNAS